MIFGKAWLKALWWIFILISAEIHKACSDYMACCGADHSLSCSGSKTDRCPPEGRPPVQEECLQRFAGAAFRPPGRPGTWAAPRRPGPPGTSWHCGSPPRRSAARFQPGTHEWTGIDCQDPVGTVWLPSSHPEPPVQVLTSQLVRREERTVLLRSDCILNFIEVSALSQIFLVILPSYYTFTQRLVGV